MAHVAKFAAGAVGNMCGHYGRTEGDGVRRSNESIDPARTHLNYNLAPEHDGGQVAFMQKRLSEVKLQKRADVKILCDWVVTLPVEDEKFKRLKPEKQEKITKDFFQASYNFLESRYGHENVVSAYVHMDEKTPHLHFAFIPVTEDRKKGGFKVSAKEVLSRSDLKSFHTDLQKALRDRGIPLDVLNGATKDGNKTVAEMKKEVIRQQVRMVEQQGAERVQAVRAEVAAAEQEAKAARVKATQEVVKARGYAEKVKGEVKALEGQKEGLQGEIGGLQGEIAALRGEREKLLTTAEVKALKGTKTLTGGLKGVTYKEYEALQRTAAEVDRMRVRVADAEVAVRAVKNREQAFVDDCNRQLQEKSAALEAKYRDLTESHKQKGLAEMQKQIEIERKLSRLEQLERFLDTHFPRWRDLFKQFQTAERGKKAPDRGRDR